MDDEQNAANHLGGLALGNVLRDLGIEHEAGLDRLGIGSANIAIKREEIYDHPFGNDDDTNDSLAPASADAPKDWEHEVDEEMRKEMDPQADQEERAALDRYYRQGMAQLSSSSKSAAAATNGRRHVENDEDDDYDNEDDEQPLSHQQQQPQTTTAPIRIKAEKDEDSEMSLLSLPLGQQQQLQQQQQSSQPPSSPQTPPPALLTRPMVDMDEIQRLFPDFEPGKVLDFTELFATRPAKKRKLISKPAQFHLHPEDELPLPQSTRDEMLQHHHRRRQQPPVVTQLAGDLLRPAAADGQQDDQVDDVDASISTAGVRAAAARQRRRRRLDTAGQLAMVELDDWEDRVALRGDQLRDSDDELPVSVEKQDKDAYDGGAAFTSALIANIDRPINHDLANGSWIHSIIWDQHSPFVTFDQLVLDMNDPHMMLEHEHVDLKAKQNSLLRSDAPASASAGASTSASAGPGPASHVHADPYNLSNDKFYEQNREHRQRVRQTLGKLVVQHAWPATKLQLPWYKTKLTKTEARSFHRPAMQFPTNMPLTFSKIRSSKKKKDGSGNAGRRGANKDPNEVLRSSRDLTLKETGPFVLYEYSEEYPPLISNLGMGSLLVNYYRKKDAKDEHIPKLDIGEPYVLDVADESPFMKFGNIESGQVQPTLYNNLIRAPLFRHKPAHTDFLLIRSTTKDDIRYYLREVKNLFVVGQTYPVQPIPGPHARLITNNIKYRLQMIAYKLIQKAAKQRIKIHRLMRYFPDQNELQMRQRLKEFMEYNRKAGDVNQGFWKLKPHIVVPEEQELFKLMPPENICLAESMQVGQRHLLDAGYTKTAEGAEDDDESKMDIEQLLAPWITSKNFINATQGKAMLKLHGDGDPTGRGEAFSFIRVSMKEIFLRAGEDADERMAQAEAEAKSKSGHKYSVAEQQAVYRSEIDRIWNAQCRALSNPVPPEITAAERDRERREKEREAREQAAENGAGGAAAGGEPTRILRIRRLVHGKWQQEIVREPAVINAYVTQRKKIEDESLATEDLVPTGNEAIDASRMKRLQEQLAHMKKNQERRIQRKNAKAAAEGLAIPGGYKKLLNKTDTKRRCGRCGEVGHMSTNTSCPMYPKEGKNGNGPSGGPSGGQGRPGLQHLASGGGGFFGPGMGMGVPGVGVPGVPGVGPVGAMSPGAMTPGAESLAGAAVTAASPSPAPGTPGASGGGGAGIKLKLKKKA